VTTILSISIVVPVLNASSTIGDMLNALTNQVGLPKDPEIIVVDGGSTDGTQEIARNFSVSLLEEHKPGPAAARNTGLRNASGEVVAHLDADTLPTRHWLSALTAPFSDSSVVLAGGNTLSFAPETPAQRYIANSGLYAAQNTISRKAFPFAPSLNMAVRRNAALAIEGWSEELMTGEDVDFSYRLLRKFPSEIVYASNAVLLHRDRKTDEELQTLAWTYGEGAAHIYLRYPEVLQWSLSNSIRLASRIVLRKAMPTIMRIGNLMGLTPYEKVEFAYYDRLWTRWFWRGFFSMYRNKEYRKPNLEVLNVLPAKSGAKGVPWFDRVHCISRPVHRTKGQRTLLDSFFS
jgi:glycosyltransferase involved in cell wall biosynthesis